MNRRGFALLAVLWVIATLSAIVGADLLVARVGGSTTRNRVLLGRAEWAREACGEIVLARFAEDPSIRSVGPVELGRGTRCLASIEDPASRVNLNTADRGALVELFREVRLDPRLADSIVARRNQGAIYDARQVPGVDSITAARLSSFTTTHGTRGINVNAAPPEVLRGLPGLNEEAVTAIATSRKTRSMRSPDDVAGALSPSSRSILFNHYAEFGRAVIFEPQQLIVLIQGSVLGSPIVARATLTAVPVAGRLAIVRRESE